MPAEIMPAAAPRPERMPKAAPRLRATKLTASPTTILRQIAAGECQPSVDGSWWFMGVVALAYRAAIVSGNRVADRLMMLLTACSTEYINLQIIIL